MEDIITIIDAEEEVLWVLDEPHDDYFGDDGDDGNDGDDDGEGDDFSDDDDDDDDDAPQKPSPAELKVLAIAAAAIHENWHADGDRNPAIVNGSAAPRIRAVDGNCMLLVDFGIGEYREDVHLGEYQGDLSQNDEQTRADLFLIADDLKDGLSLDPRFIDIDFEVGVYGCEFRFQFASPGHEQATVIAFMHFI